MPAVKYQFQAQGQKDIESAFKQIANASDKSTKSVQRDTEVQRKALEALGHQAQKTAEKISEARVKQSKKDTDQIIADYQRQVKAAKDASEQIKEAFKKSKPDSGGGGGIGKLASLGLGAVGGFAVGLATTAIGLAKDTIGAAIRESNKVQEIANRISISSRGFGEKYADPTQLRKSFENTAMATPGITAEEIAQGTAAFVSKTGRLDIAQQMQGTFATTASATGASVEEIANAAAALFDKFDIKSVEEMQSAFAKLTYQGKQGSFELKDAAAQFDRLTSAASRFDIGKGVEAAATLGGLTQIARSSTGSSEQASTAVQAMFRQLLSKATDLKGAGVSVFDASGNSRKIQDILVDTISKVGGKDLSKKKIALQGVFGDEGIAAVSPLIQVFNEAYTAAKANNSEAKAMEIAQQALRNKFEETINAAGNWKAIQEDAGRAQQDASAQLTAAWESVKAEIGDKVIPVLIKDFLPALKNAIPAIKKVVEALGEFLTFLGRISESHDEKTTRRLKDLDEQELDLESKLKFRAESPEHQQFDVDEDPIYNSLVRQRDRVLQQRKNILDIDKQKAEVESMYKNSQYFEGKDKKEAAKIAKEVADNHTQNQFEMGFGEMAWSMLTTGGPGAQAVKNLDELKDNDPNDPMGAMRILQGTATYKFKENEDLKEANRKDEEEMLQYAKDSAEAAKQLKENLEGAAKAAKDLPLSNQ